MGVIGGARTAYTSGASEVTPVLVGFVLLNFIMCSVL